MVYYDTHTHLNDPKLYPKRNEYLENFINIWWKWLVNVWVDKDWNQRAIQIAKISKQKYPEIKVLATIGYHPSEIVFLKENNKSQWIKDKINELKNVYSIEKDYIYGIGECGIDVHYPGWKENLNYQKEFFALQCELAQEFDLPIVIHSRDDFESTLDIVKNFKYQKIYFHCWWYWPKEVRKVLDTFDKVWIGFAGNVTYPKANDLRESLKILSIDKFVLETDAPYLTPQKKRWQTNQPANVKLIYEFVSEFLWIDIKFLAENMENNFEELYLR